MLKAIQVCTVLIMLLGLGINASADNGGDKTMKGKPNDRISAKAASDYKQKIARTIKMMARPEKCKAKKKIDTTKFVLDQMKRLKNRDNKYGLQFYLKKKVLLYGFTKG